MEVCMVKYFSLLLKKAVCIWSLNFGLYWDVDADMDIFALAWALCGLVSVLTTLAQINFIVIQLEISMMHELAISLSAFLFNILIYISNGCWLFKFKVLGFLLLIWFYLFAFLMSRPLYAVFVKTWIFLFKPQCWGVLKSFSWKFKIASLTINLLLFIKEIL